MNNKKASIKNPKYGISKPIEYQPLQFISWQRFIETIIKEINAGIMLKYYILNIHKYNNSYTFMRMKAI